MRVKFGQQEFTFPGSQLGELRDSSELVGNPPALRERMAEEGYLFLRGLLDRDKVLTARERVLAYMHQQQALAPGQPVLEGVMPKGSRNPQILGRRGVSHHPDVRAVLEAPKLFEFWREYYGEPVGTFDYKWLRAVGNEEFTGCHYDIVYMGRGSRRLHTCWIPMGDLPVEQGTLAVCIGSHNLPCFERLRQTYGNMDVDRDLTEGLFTSNPQEITERFGGQWATTNFRAGDVLAFGLYTMHASTTNITNHARLDNQHHQPLANQLRRSLSACCGLDGRAMDWRNPCCPLRRRCRGPDLAHDGRSAGSVGGLSSGTEQQGGPPSGTVVALQVSFNKSIYSNRRETHHGRVQSRHHLPAPNCL